MLTAEKVLNEHYGVKNATLTRLSGGLIHMTLKVETETGEVCILQSVAPIFKPTVMQDIAAVLSHLSQMGFVTEDIIPTLKGDTHVADGDRFWRMFTFIPGRMFPESEITKGLAFEAGTLLGQYHVCLENLEHQFVHVRPAKHNFQATYEKYTSVAHDNLSVDLKHIAEPIAEIPTLLPPANFRTHATHGDPKINNFIFSETEPYRAVSMIDLDDCGSQYNASIEVAKALKSWCTKIADNGSVSVYVEILKAGIEGYRQAAGNFLTPEEWQWIPTGMQLLSLELGTRFLIDTFEDCYFDWDQERYKSRKEHNLDRFKEQLAMFNALKKSQSKLDFLVSQN